VGSRRRHGAAVHAVGAQRRGICCALEKTFGLELQADSAYAAAGRAALPPGLQKAFDRVEPLSFAAGRKAKQALEKAPKKPEPVEASPAKRGKAVDAEDELDEEQAELIERIETTRFLGPELLLWIWLRQELLSDPVALGELGEAEVWLDRKLTLEHIGIAPSAWPYAARSRRVALKRAKRCAT